jgi:hypothetical protein
MPEIQPSQGFLPLGIDPDRSPFGTHLHGCTIKKKELPMLSSFPHSFREKNKKGDFNSTCLPAPCTSGHSVLSSIPGPYGVYILSPSDPGLFSRQPAICSSFCFSGTIPCSLLTTLS